MPMKEVLQKYHWRFSSHPFFTSHYFLRELIFFPFFITAYGWYEVSCTRRSRFKSKRQSSYQEIINDASCQKFSRQEPMNLRTVCRNFAKDQLSIHYVNKRTGWVQKLANFPDTLFVLTLGELIYTCKIIQPGIFSRFSQPVYFSRL